MKFGISCLLTDQAIAIPVLAQAIEERGFESFWFGEHTHIPVYRAVPWPGGPVIPDEYKRFLDPFLVLSQVAAVTSRLRIGTGICIVPDHDPIILAKQVASLDVISHGRFNFGIGGGWCHEEVANHGVDPALRWKVMRERVLAMKAIWTNDEAEFHGQFVNFDPIWQWPKPVQKPHPPIIVAGEGLQALRRTVEYGDGWNPVIGRGTEPIEASIEKLNRLANAAGRGNMAVTLNGAPEDPATLQRYVKAGVERCIFRVPDHPVEEILRRLDQLAKLAEQV